MIKSLLSFAGAAIIVGCASASFADGNKGPVVTHEHLPPPAAAAREPLICSIEATKVSGGIHLSAIVDATHRVAGTYELTLTKSGPAGSSDISQGGEFDAAPGRTTVLSGSEMSLERGSLLTAHLKLLTPSGAVACEDRFEA